MCSKKLALLLSASTFLGTSLAAAQVPILGRVTDENGIGLAKARIELVRISSAYESGVETLHGEPPEVESAAFSDEKGFYETSGEVGGLYRLRVSGPGRLGLERTIGPLVQPVELKTLRLSRVQELGIRVIDGGGKPVPGARLMVLNVGDQETLADMPWWPTTRSGTTDKEGIVTLVHRASESLEIVAFAQGFMDARTYVRRPAEVTLKLETGLARTVEVRDEDGNAVAEVLVEVGPSRVPAGLTGEDGRFEVRVSRHEPLPVIAETATGLYAKAEIPPVSGESPEAEVVVLDLRVPETVSGRVIDAASRRPLAGVWLALQGKVTQSSRDGSYSIPAQPHRGSGSLTAAAAGYVEVNERVVRRGSVARETDLELRPALVAEGLVVDEDRQPVAGAEIRVHHGVYRRSDHEGRFRFTAAPNTVYGLKVSMPGFLTATPEVSVDPHDETPFEVVLGRGRMAYGYVVDPDDAPIAGARVRRWESDGYSDRSDSDISTGEDGRFEIQGLGAAKFDLFIQAQGFARTYVSRLGIPEDEAGHLADVDLGTIRLEKAVLLEGRVADQEGRPLAGAIVRTWSRQTESRRREAMTPEVESGEEGRFVITDRAAGEEFIVSGRLQGYEQAHLTVTVPAAESFDAEELELVLSQQATVRAQIVDQQGRPVPKAKYTAFSPEGSGTGNQSDVDGRFETTVDPGRVKLTARKDDLRSSDVWLEVSPGEVVEGVRLVLEPMGAVVEGVVVGPDGKPVTRARIRAMAAFMVRPQWTDGEGRFRLTGLEPGPLQFEVWFGNRSRIRREMTLESGINPVEVRLPSMHDVHGQVFDQVGQGLGGAYVRMSGDGGNAVATSRADGSFVVEDVPEGEYKLSATKEGFFDPEPARAVDIDAGPVFDLEVRLDLTGAVDGRLSGLEDGAELRVRVEAYPVPPPSATEQEPRQRRPRIQGTVEAEGRFRFDTLHPGRWTIEAHDPTTGRRATGQVTVESGTRARLDLTLGLDSSEE